MQQGGAGGVCHPASHRGHGGGCLGVVLAAGDIVAHVSQARQHQQRAASVTLQVVRGGAEHQAPHRVIAARAHHEDVHLVAKRGQLLARESIHRLALDAGQFLTRVLASETIASMPSANPAVGYPAYAVHGSETTSSALTLASIRVASP